MITNSTIVECFDCLVGWRESAAAGTCYGELPDSLKHSDSSVYINDLPGIKLELINDMMGKYQSSVNEYLENLYSDSSIKVARQFINVHKKHNYAKALLNNYDLGIYATNIRRTQAKRSRFVGFEIIPHGGNSVNAQVMQFGGMFDAIQSDLPFYFYSSKQAEPLLTFTGNINKANSLVWFDLNTTASGSGSDDCTSLIEIIAKYINKEEGHGARYYIGYYEDDLDTDNLAIETKQSCSTCGNSNKTMNAYCTVRPIEVASANTYVDRSLFDLEAVGISDNTYGLHLKLNITCDISEPLCDNKMLFANALRLQHAITISWDMFNSTALNRLMGSKKEDFKLNAEKYELDLEDELKSLSIDFSNVDPICLGKKKAAFGVMGL
jgi:hypothetical protein